MILLRVIVLGLCALLYSGEAWSQNVEDEIKKTLLNDLEKNFVFSKKLKKYDYVFELKKPTPQKFIKTIMGKSFPFKIKKMTFVYSLKKSNLSIKTNLRGAAKKAAEAEVEKQLKETDVYKVLSQMTLNFFHEVKNLIMDQANVEIIKHNKDVVDFELTNLDEFILKQKVDSIRISYDRNRQHTKCIVYIADGTFYSFESQLKKKSADAKKKSRNKRMSYPVWLRFQAGVHKNNKIKTKVDCKLDLNVKARKTASK